LSCREKGSLAHSLQVAHQQAEDLRQELEKLQVAHEELRRQRDLLEEEHEDTTQDSSRAHRELERRWASLCLTARALPVYLGLLTASLGPGSIQVSWPKLASLQSGGSLQYHSDAGL
jgi:hypothetical protein